MIKKPSLIEYLLENNTTELPDNLEDYDAGATVKISQPVSSSEEEINALLYLLRHRCKNFTDEHKDYLLAQSDLNLFYRGGNALMNILIFNVERQLNFTNAQLDYLIRHTNLNVTPNTPIRYAIEYNITSNLYFTPEQFEYMFEHTELDIHKKFDPSITTLLFFRQNYIEERVILNNATWGKLADIYFNSFNDITSGAEYAVIEQFSKSSPLFEKVWPYITNKEKIIEVLKRKSQVLFQCDFVQSYIEKTHLEQLVSDSNTFKNLNKI